MDILKIKLQRQNRFNLKAPDLGAFIYIYEELRAKLGFIGELPKPSPVGEGGPPMAVDEEFLRVCNYSSVCSPIFDFNNFMHVTRIHLLSQEKAYVLAISYIFCFQTSL